MIYKTYNCNSFNVHTIKTDKFKTCHMEILFGHPVQKEKLCMDSFLADILAETNAQYKTRKEVVAHLEELYKTVFYSVTTKVGKTLTSSFVLDFINPSFIDEESYLEDVLKFPFDMLQNPKVINGEFDLKQFNFVKERMRKEIQSLNESGMKVALRKALEAMDSNSPSSYSVLGTLEDLDKVTPSNLYQLYQKFFKDNTCDIFIIGDLDMDQVVSLIRKYFKNRIINDSPRLMYVENEIKKKELILTSEDEYIQANLVMLFSIDKLTKEEKDVVFHVFNYLLGSGGLTSKLYKVIREENTLCYSITSMYLKYDGLLAVYLSLDNEGVKKAIQLAKKCVKSLVKGEFDEDDLEDAKKNLILSMNLSMDNNIAILNNYIFNIFDNLPSIEERKEKILAVTKEDIINVAKKVKPNTVYVLKGGKK